jgi:hypothetical protein
MYRVFLIPLIMAIISKDSIILKQSKNLKSMDKDAILKETINDNGKELTDVNRAQMRAGRMGNGYLPDYSPFSQTLKDKSNYKASWPTMDLYDTGSFQDKMFLQTTSKSVLFDSKDSKRSDLLKRFTDEIFELDEPSIKQAQEIVTPKYFNSIHKAINK